MVSVGRGRDVELHKKLDQVLKSTSEITNPQVQEILKILKDLQEKLDRQGKVLTKIAVYVSKLYQDGEINKETFNKLDEFLKPYYDDSNLLKDY